MAVRVQAVDLDKEKTEEIVLNEAVFDAPVKPHLLHDVVKMQLANRRAVLRDEELGLGDRSDLHSAAASASATRSCASRSSTPTYSSGKRKAG